MSPSAKDYPEKHRITVRDIAEEVGLHFTTVAEALRGSTRIKESTRERVNKAAVRLGYRPDPVLSALSAYRSSKLRGAFQGVLAWINGFDSQDTYTKAQSFYGDCYTGALERSKSLGYNLELFWTGHRKMSGARISEILKNRNIVGVIVGPMPKITDNIDLQWEHFTSVRIGHSLTDNRITNIISDQFQNTQFAFEKLYNEGFRKIGFACPKNLDNRLSNKFSGGYMSSSFRRLGSLPIAPFLDDEKDGDAESFLRWYRKYTPEVILAGGRTIYYKFLTGAGIKVPEDVQFVSLHAEYNKSPVAGISQNGIAVGGVAVDHLISMIQSFKIGLEAYPKTTMVLGRWVDGASYNPGLLKNES